MRRDQASETETRDRTPARRQVPAPGARTRLRGGLGGPVMVSIVVLALVAWGRPAPAADCGDWNTRRFFETATPRLVRECLAAGADLKVRAKYGTDAPALRGRAHCHPSRDRRPDHGWGRPEGAGQVRTDAPPPGGRVQPHLVRDRRPT